MRTALGTMLSVVCVVALCPMAAGAQRGMNWDRDAAMTVRDSIHENVRLDRGAAVSVEGIAGPVTIVTGGGDTATVDIVRMAASQRELDCYRTEVSGSPARLVIRHVQQRTRECRNIRSRQEVRLTLPSNVDLALESIAGNVEIGALVGHLVLSSIAGQVRAESVRSANLSSIAGGLSIGLGPLDARGVEISSVVGPTRIAFDRGANADVRIDSVQGDVRSLSPSLPIDVVDGEVHARVGAGGPGVSISSIVGLVELSGG